MERVFDAIEEISPRQRSRQPLPSGGAAAISKDGKIAYATIQYDVQDNKLDKERRGKSSPPRRVRRAMACR